MAKLEKTKTPGIFKRGNRYAVIYRDGGGQQRQESARTYDEARRLRTKRAAAVTDGSYQPQTRERLAEFAAAWTRATRATGVAASVRTQGVNTGATCTDT